MLIGLTYEECQACLDNCDSADLVVSNFLRFVQRSFKIASVGKCGQPQSLLLE